eukprot:705826_1
MDPWDDICGYEDLGGAENIEVSEFGYCQRKDTGDICFQAGECAELLQIVPNSNSIGESFGNTLCSPNILDDVASYNYFWLNGVLITKCVGLIFLLLLDLRSCINKVKPDEKEAEQAEKCARCRNWGKECCCETLILLLKAIFLVFGTFATLAAVYYMQLTGHVWTSTCSSLSDDTLKDQCVRTETECNDGDNYYAVVFDSLDLGGPYWADVISNLLHTTMWIVRVAVMRYAIKQTHMADV